uniref:Uncharacterized protein n=1 Tax=Oryza glaberrima TaxID=4538 RepID=I1NZC6_ORYGL
MVSDTCSGLHLVLVCLHVLAEVEMGVRFLAKNSDIRSVVTSINSACM